MATIVSTMQQLPNVVPSVSSGVAPGYDAWDLLRGDVARVFLSLAAANSHDISIQVNTLAFPDLVAVFDAGSVGGFGARPNRVQIFSSSAWPIVGSPPLTGELVAHPSGRGDWIFTGTIPAGTKGIRLRLFFGGASRLSVGLVWIGNRLALPHSFLTLGESQAFAVISNESEGGSVYAHELADYRTHLALKYNNTTEADFAAIAATWRESRGGLRPSVLVLDDAASPPRFFHGRFAAEAGAEVTYPGIRAGLALEFLESGRVLGA